jgi:hypothetical protein
VHQSRASLYVGQLLTSFSQAAPLGSYTAPSTNGPANLSQSNTSTSKAATTTSAKFNRKSHSYLHATRPMSPTTSTLSSAV